MDIMREDWFLAGLRWSPEEYQAAKARVLSGQVTDRYEILKVWGRLFFEEGTGLVEYTKFLRRLLSGDESRASFNTRDDYKREITFKRRLAIEQNFENWFYSHCWMIKGGDRDEVERGRTSRMPRNLLYCQKEKNYDPDDEHYTDEYFIRLLSDDALSGLLSQALENLNDYPALNEAIGRFRKSRNRISGSAGWYLRVNGNVAQLALGITDVDYPDEYAGEKWVSIINGIGPIAKKITGGDSVFFSMGELRKNNICDEEEIKPKFGKKGQEGEAEVLKAGYPLKLGELNERLGSNRPLFFNVPADPQIRDYRAVSFAQDDMYNRRFIWVVGGKCPQHADVACEIPLTGYSGVYCWKCELADIDQEVRSFPKNEDAVFFRYRLRQSVTYEGFDNELSDALHEWIVFTGASVSLRAANNDEWSQNDFADGRLVLSEDGCSCIVSSANSPEEIFAVRIHHVHPTRYYKVLYVPRSFKEKIRDHENFETGDWSYAADNDEHIDKLEHINRYCLGTLTNAADDISVPIRCDMPEMKPMAWIEPGRGGFERFSAAECRIPQTLDSYSELAGKYLCIAPACRSETAVIRHSDGTSEEKLLQSGEDGIIREEICQCMTFTGVIDPRACDTLCWQDQEILSVHCCPSKPELFCADDGRWKLYAPRARRNGYRVFILSEKFLETLSPDHYCCVPFDELFGDGSAEIVDLKVPESLPKEHALHSCIITKDVSLNDVLQMNGALKKIRGATADGTRFDNASMLSAVLAVVKFQAEFTDARYFAATAAVTPDALERFWENAVGRISPNDLSEDIAYCLEFLLQKGYNFLCEFPADDGKADYGKTWLTTAFEMLCSNAAGQELKTDSFSLAGLKAGQRRKFQNLLEIVLDNQDARKDNFIKGEGWLSPICAAFLLYGRNWAGKDITRLEGNRLKIQTLLEQSGIRDLTSVASIFGAWSLEIEYQTDRYSEIEPFSRRNFDKRKENIVRIILPDRDRFLDDQSGRYQDEEVFFPEEEIYGKEEFQETLRLTKNIIDKCHKPSGGRVIGNHLLTFFQWICENVRRHFENGEEDVEHTTLGILAIACRLAAHRHAVDLLNPDEYKFMLGIVRKAFAEKFDTRHAPPESERRQAATARWRYLMRCIVSVEVTIAFFNVAYTGDVIEQKTNRNQNWR